MAVVGNVKLDKSLRVGVTPGVPSLNRVVIVMGILFIVLYLLVLVEDEVLAELVVLVEDDVVVDVLVGGGK